MPVSDAAYQRGLQFLLSAQAADGSWHVVSRLKPPAPVSPPYFETGYPYGHDQFISAMGACWAVTALARALASTRSPASIDFAIDLKTGAEPWVEAVLFGSAADVKSLLDKKLDPNSATKTGGTTALMLAMPDLEKAKLLIDRGANVNARAKSRFSALMVAAQYPASGATMRYLLSRHAEVRLPKGAGTPLYNASPIMLAAISRNADMIRPLKDAGDDPNAKTIILGMFPNTPLMQIVGFSDLPTMTALLDAGVPVDDPDGDGITALSWAVIDNHPDAARLLIERKADVNHLDKKGMTPLLYASSIDFGDPAMVEMLLKAGANPNAKTPEGLTAAQLAKKYGHALR
jgi:ankyrin repeat protein